MPKYEIVLGKDLKPGDIIIHKYQRFLIKNCGNGKGAGSTDFGEYTYVDGNFIYKSLWEKMLGWKSFEDFWTYQECPIIRESVDDE